MLLAHKIRLYPNREQLSFFQKSAGVARFSYNWALAEWQKQYKAKLKPSEANLRKQLNSIKANDYPWMAEVTKSVPQQAIKNLGIAYKNFFRRVKAGKKPGYPRFKKKGLSKDSFRPDNGSTKTKDALVTKGKKVKIPKLGFVKMAEPVRFSGKIVSSTISRVADRWFISILVDTSEALHVRENQGSCGVDVGINCLAALSNGRMYAPAKALSRHSKKLRILARQQSRKREGSANRGKATVRLARQYYKISCVRLDNIHKATTDIVLNNTFIALETLNVSGMAKNHKLAKAVADASMAEFQRQIIYKAEMYGSQVHKIDRWFPSTKLCTNCGQLHDMPLSKRIFTCDCGISPIDRDIHAAQSILGQALAELTPVEMEALANSSIVGETIVCEAGIDHAR